MKTHAPLSLVPIVLLALVLAACAGASMAPPSMPQSTGGAAPAPAQPPAVAEAPAEAGRGAALDAGTTANYAMPDAQTQQGIERLVIKNASVSLQVESVRDAEAAIRAKVEQLGGYVVQVSNQGTDQYLTSQITFRVPAERFEEALNGVQGLAKRVLSRTISGDDVTEEFVDLESRLRNLEATRTRLLDLLEKATRVEDALNVNNALTQVQGEIEQIRGRMQYLQQSAALSTVNVSLEPVPVTPIITEYGWQPLEVARAALRDLVEFGQGLAELGIVLLIWAPVWLPLLLLGRWLLGWAGRKMRQPISPAQPAAPPENPPASPSV